MWNKNAGLTILSIDIGNNKWLFIHLSGIDMENIDINLQ